MRLLRSVAWPTRSATSHRSLRSGQAAILSVALLLVSLTGSHADEPQTTSIRFARTESEQLLLTALETPVSLPEASLPLRDLIAELSKQCGVLIQPDLVALDEEGLSLNDQYDCKLLGVSCRQFIESQLEPYGMTWTIHRGIVEITTKTMCDEQLLARSYDVAAILRLARPYRERLQEHRESKQFTGGSMPAPNHGKGSPGSRGLGFFQVPTLPQSTPLLQHQFGSTGSLGGLGPAGPHHGFHPGVSSATDADDHAWLMDFVMSHTSGPWSVYEGTGGNIDLFGNVLVVRHHFQQLIEVELLLNGLVECATMQGDSLHGICASRSPAQSTAASKLSAALQKKVELHFDGKPLDEAMDDLQKHYGVHIVIDRRALEDEGLSVDLPVQLNVSGITLRSALRLMLEPIGMASRVEGPVLRVLSIARAEELYETYLFNVSSIDDKHSTLKGLAAIIQNSTPGPWLNIDGDGGTLTLVLPNLLAVSAHAGTIKATREVLQQINATITSAATEDNSTSRTPFIRKLYPVKDEETAKQLVEVLPLVVPQSAWSSGAILRHVDQTLILYAPQPLHDSIAEFLADLDAHESTRVKRIRVSPEAIDRSPR